MQVVSIKRALGALMTVLSLGVLAMPQAANAAKWSIQYTPIIGSEYGRSFAGVSCSGPLECTAVGYYTVTGLAEFDALAETWNGSRDEWLPETQPPLPANAEDSKLNGVSCQPTMCMAVGWYLVKSATVPLVEYRRGGYQWVVQSTPAVSGTLNMLNAVSCSSSTACTAVGGSIVERWNGTEWKVQSIPTSSEATKLEGVSCYSSTTCVAVGYEENAGAKVPLSELWNGTEWKLLSTPNPEGKTSELKGIACASFGCIAVGRYSKEVKPGKKAPTSLAERWTGTEWKVLSTPTPEKAAEWRLSGVSCQSSGTTCTAVGYYEESAQEDVRTLAEGWNGAEWKIQSTPNVEKANFDELYGVSCPSGELCTAVGKARNTLAERYE
jgi:hypothetical protein